MSERTTFLGQWLQLNNEDNDDISRAKIQDIEFETGFGPLFLMNDVNGNTYWMTRKELREREITGPYKDFRVYDQKKSSP